MHVIKAQPQKISTQYLITEYTFHIRLSQLDRSIDAVSPATYNSSSQPPSQLGYQQC